MMLCLNLSLLGCSFFLWAKARRAHREMLEHDRLMLMAIKAAGRAIRAQCDIEPEEPVLQ